MARLLRSVYSDPVAAGIQSFGAISDILDRREGLQMRREMMEREGEERQLRMTGEKETQQYNRDVRQRMGLQWAREDDLTAFNSAVQKLDSNQELDDSDYDAVLKVTHNATNWKDLKPEQWGELHNNLRSLKAGIDKVWPQIAESWKQGKGVSISRSQAPELFSVWDKIPSYGGEVNKGNDRLGTPEGVEKSLETIYFDPRNGTMTPHLRVKDSKGDTYEAPMTADRGNDPNAPIVQLPVQLFNAHLNAQLKMADWADAVRMKLGDKEAGKRHESQKETLRQNQVWLAGEDALEDLLKTKPTANVNEQRNAFKKAVREKSKEMGIAISEKDITGEAGKIEKTVTTAPATKSFQVGDKVVEHQWNATTGKWEPVAGVEGPKFKEGKKPSAIEEFEEVEKMPPAKKGRFLTYQKGKSEAKEKPKVEIKTDEEGNMLRVDVDTGKATPVIDEKGKPIKGKKELTTADMNLIMRKSKVVDMAIENDSSLETDDKPKISEYAEGLLKANPSLGTREIINQAKRDLDIKPSAIEVGKEMKGKPKGKYKVEGHLGVWDGEIFKWTE